MGRTIRRGRNNFIPKTEPMRERRKQGYEQYKGISLEDVEENYDDEIDDEDNF